MTDGELSANYRIQAANGNKGGPTKRGSGLLLPVLEHRHASELRYPYVPGCSGGLGIGHDLDKIRTKGLYFVGHPSGSSCWCTFANR